MDCAHLLTSASSSLVNVPDKRGLTALHWANAEQHVKLMKLLLAKGAVWSDADLLSMVRDFLVETKCLKNNEDGIWRELRIMRAFLLHLFLPRTEND